MEVAAKPPQGLALSEQSQQEQENLHDVHVQLQCSKDVLLRAQFHFAAAHEHLGVKSQECHEEDSPKSSIHRVYDPVVGEDCENAKQKQGPNSNEQEASTAGEVKLCMAGENRDSQAASCTDSGSHEHGVGIMETRYCTNHVGHHKRKEKQQDYICRVRPPQALTAD